MSTHFYDYPRPWVADDNREGHEGLITVFDANGRPVVITGDMESAGMADIQNGYLFAAAPELLAACEALLATEIGAGPTAYEAARIAARAAITKAKGPHQ